MKKIGFIIALLLAVGILAHPLQVEAGGVNICEYHLRVNEPAPYHQGDFVTFRLETVVIKGNCRFAGGTVIELNTYCVYDAPPMTVYQDVDITIDETLQLGPVPNELPAPGEQYVEEWPYGTYCTAAAYAYQYKRGVPTSIVSLGHLDQSLYLEDAD